MKRPNRSKWLWRGAAGGGLAAVVLAGGSGVRAEAAPPKADEAAAEVFESAKCGRVFPGRGGKPIGKPHQGSAVALVRWAKARIAYVAHEDDRAIHAIDVGLGKEIGSTNLDGTPSSVLVLADGRVVVAIRDRQRVDVFEPGATAGEALVRRCSIRVAEEPVALAVSPGGDTLAVTSAWGRKLTALDVTSMTRKAEVDLPREPRAIVIDGDGSRAFVAHVVESKLSVVDLPDAASSSSPSVRTIDLTVTRGVGGTKQEGCQGFALAKAVLPDPKLVGEKPAVKGDAPPPAAGKPAKRGKKPPAGEAPTPAEPATPQAPPAIAAPIEGRIFAPMVAVDTGDTTVSSGGYGAPERGPAERPLVSIVDEGAERALTRSASTDRAVSTNACLLPRAAAFVASQQSLLVACLGSNAVVELDGRALDPSRRERRRVPVAAGPTGLAVDEHAGEAVVFSQFASKLTVISLAGTAVPRTIDVPLAAARAPANDVLRGRVLFHATADRRISMDGRACASCHPDGRDDALTWSTPNGPRQTIMLAGRLRGSAPFGWNGTNKTVESHVVETFVRLDGTGFHSAADKADLAALLAYLGSMQAPARGAPTAANAALVEKGKELFYAEEQACATCHTQGGTDGRSYKVAKADASGRDAPIDTPSLRAVAGTAPYFHDGRFETLDALLASPDHSMGHTLHLTRKDRLALAAYLETL